MATAGFSTFLFCRQISRPGGNGTAGRALADLTTDAVELAHDLWPARPMDGAVDATAAGQRRIRSIDNRVGRDARDIAFAQGDRLSRRARPLHVIHYNR